MVTLNYLRVCGNCGNVFSKRLGSDVVEQCPACKANASGHVITLE